MINLQLLIIIVISSILSCAHIGNCFQQEMLHSKRRPSLNTVQQLPEKIFVGIPLLYQQRKDLARDLGINPYNLMGNRNDYMYRDHHPLEDENNNNFLLKPRINKTFRPSHRIMKRGIIWNKIKKIKKGIHSVKKKMWKIKSRAVSIIKGPKSTERPSYASTGGSWGHGSNSNGWTQGVSMPVVPQGWSRGPGGYRSPRSSYYTSRIGQQYEQQPNYKGIAVRSRL